MAYATLQDLIDRYGESAVVVASDTEGTGELDEDAVNKALNDATSLIQSYLRKRYRLPLPLVPTVLTNLSATMAYYLLSGDPTTLTKEKRQRYEDSVKLLAAIADGRVLLAIEPAQSSDVVLVSNRREFTRRTMKGL